MLSIGWTGLLVPSLIRSIEAAFDQTDAGLGLVFLLYSLAYAAASFVGGPLTERCGRRVVIGGAALLHAAGIASLGVAPSWAAFVLLTIPAGLGAGVLDGGANGLFLDLFREGRGRAMNLLHFVFSVGALSAPLAIGALVEGGVAWEAVMIGSGVLPLLVAILFALVSVPSGRRRGHRSADRERSGGAQQDSGSALAGSLARPLVLLGLAIAAYVGSEVGVSNWLVRFLEPAPLTTATLALSLYWAGLAVGRLISSGIADRFDHVRFTGACAVLLAAAVVLAVLVPSLAVSIALFTVAGVASGPIFPMIQAIGGERFADRSAAVAGLLTGFAVAGGTVYPPLMGVLSVTVGLPIAMLGAGALGIVCAAMVLASDRRATA